MALIVSITKASTYTLKADMVEHSFTRAPTQAGLPGEASSDTSTFMLDLGICLTEETKVLAKHKNTYAYKSIKDIQEGEKVVTHLGRYRTVLKKFVREIDENICILFLHNGEIIRITNEHPVLTKRGWVKAIDLLKSDVLYRLSETSEAGIFNFAKRKNNDRWDDADIAFTCAYCGKNKSKT